jgi:hypothetical protein
MEKPTPLKLELFERDSSEYGTGCLGGNCPHVYRTGRKTFVVQGSILDAATLASLGLPGHETAVEIPEDLLVGLVDKLNDFRR